MGPTARSDLVLQKCQVMCLFYLFMCRKKAKRVGLVQNSLTHIVTENDNIPALAIFKRECDSSRF